MQFSIWVFPRRKQAILFISSIFIILKKHLKSLLVLCYHKRTLLLISGVVLTMPAPT